MVSLTMYLVVYMRFLACFPSKVYIGSGAHITKREALGFCFVYIFTQTHRSAKSIFPSLVIELGKSSGTVCCLERPRMAEAQVNGYNLS